MSVKKEMGLLVLGVCSVIGTGFLINKYVWKGSWYFNEQSRKKHLQAGDEMKSMINATIPNMNGVYNPGAVNEMEKVQNYEKRI